MRIAIIQFSPVSLSPEKNGSLILDRYREAANDGAELAVFPELALTGPDAGLLLGRRDYLERSASMVREIAAASGTCGIVFGAPLTDPEGRVYNCLILAAEGAVLHVHQQILLPFDASSRDRRFFSPGSEVSIAEFREERIGLLCGGDARAVPGWPETVRYRIDPAVLYAEQGATLLVNATALPYRSGKNADRRAMGTYHSARHNLPFLLCNMSAVRAPDIFDGASYFLSNTGTEKHLPHCREGMTIVDTASPEALPTEAVDGTASDRRVLVHGIRETVRRSGRKAAILADDGAAAAFVRELTREALGEAPSVPGKDDRQTLFPITSGTLTTRYLGEKEPEGFAPLGDLTCDEIRAFVSGGEYDGLPLPFEGDEDRILSLIIREGRTPEDLISSGFPEATVLGVASLAALRNPDGRFSGLQIHDPGACPPPAGKMPERP